MKNQFSKQYEPDIPLKIHFPESKNSSKTNPKEVLKQFLSHDTSAFVCDNLAHFWQSKLQWHYPEAEWLLLLCDGGGSNNARHHIVFVAHYPPYCSKWNLIEHRFFCHVHKAWDGITFQNIQFVKEQAEKTSTDSGLGIKVWINEQNYPTKRPLNTEFLQNRANIIQCDPICRCSIMLSCNQIVSLFFKRSLL